MKGIINIGYPELLATSLKLKGKAFENEVKTTSVLKLYEIGRISSGIAAQVLGISRIEFLELLAKYNISLFNDYDANDIREDIANA